MWSRARGLRPGDGGTRSTSTAGHQGPDRLERFSMNGYLWVWRDRDGSLKDVGQGCLDQRWRGLLGGRWHRRDRDSFNRFSRLLWKVWSFRGLEPGLVRKYTDQAKHHPKEKLAAVASTSGHKCLARDLEVKQTEPSQSLAPDRELSRFLRRLAGKGRWGVARARHRPGTVRRGRSRNPGR